MDGIYPRFAFFVSPFPDPTTEVEVTFNRLQEALRKDVERLYAVLTPRFHVALHPAKYSTVEQMITVTKAVAIRHNMITEKRRDGYVSRTRMAAGGQAAGGGGAAGPAGRHGGAAGNAGGGNVGGSAHSLFRVTSWSLRGDTGASCVAKKSPTGATKRVIRWIQGDTQANG